MPLLVANGPQGHPVLFCICSCGAHRFLEAKVLISLSLGDIPNLKERLQVFVPMLSPPVPAFGSVLDRLFGASLGYEGTNVAGFASAFATREEPARPANIRQIKPDNSVAFEIFVLVLLISLVAACLRDLSSALPQIW